MSSRLVKTLRQRNMQFDPSKATKPASPTSGHIVILLNADNVAVGYGTISTYSPTKVRELSLDTIRTVSKSPADAQVVNVLLYDNMIMQLRAISDPSERTRHIREYALTQFGHAGLAETLVYDSAFKYAVEHRIVMSPSKTQENRIIPVFDPAKVYNIHAPKITSLDKIKSPNSHLLLFNVKRRIIGHAITVRPMPEEGVLNIETYATCTYFYEKYHAAYVKYVAPIDDHLYQVYVLKSTHKSDAEAKQHIVNNYVEAFIHSNKDHTKGKTGLETHLIRIFEGANKNNSKRADVFDGFNMSQHNMISEPVGLNLIDVGRELGKVEDNTAVAYMPIRHTRKKLPAIQTGKMGGSKNKKTGKNKNKNKK